MSETDFKPRRYLTRLVSEVNWIWLLLPVHITFLLLNVSQMEFFGEDEIGTALINSRLVVGLTTGNLHHFVALLADSQPPVRNLVQIPFIWVLGVRELAIYLPHALASLGIFWVLVKLGQRCLDRVGTTLLVLLYTASAAYAINRSPNAHGFFLLFLLGAFLCSEHYRKNGSYRSLAAAWLLAALATITFLEGVLFAIYLLVASIPPGERLPKCREWRMILLAYGLPLVLYILGFYLLPILVLGRTIGNLAHLEQRQTDLHLSLANLSLMVLNYLYTFGPMMAALLAGAVVFTVANWRRLPNTMLRLVAFFGLHLVVWLFLLDRECGHTLYAYPLFLTLAAWALAQGLDRLKEATRVVGLVGLALVCIFSAIYNYMSYNNINQFKTIAGFRFWQNYLPCGVNPAHQVGLKTAAYLIRRSTNPQDLYLGNTGESMNEFYLDRQSPRISVDEMVDAMRLNTAQEVYASTSIRFVGLVTQDARFSYWGKALDAAAPRWLEARQPDGTLTLIIWDLSRQPVIPSKPRQVMMNEDTAAFDREFSQPLLRFSSWLSRTTGINQ